MICGIDPGAQGYIVVLEVEKETPRLRVVHKLPRLDGQNLDSLKAHFYELYVFGVRIAFIERPGTYTQNHNSLTKQHREYAEIRCCGMQAGISMVDIKPKEWKGYFKLTKDKQQSIVLAQRLIDGLPPMSIKDNDLAEACLIGYYGWLVERFTSKLL